MVATLLLPVSSSDAVEDYAICIGKITPPVSVNIVQLLSGFRPGLFTEGDAAQVGDENLGQTKL
jgi:hypothetical protein